MEIFNCPKAKFQVEFCFEKSLKPTLYISVTLFISDELILPSIKISYSACFKISFALKTMMKTLMQHSDRYVFSNSSPSHFKRWNKYH